MKSVYHLLYVVALYGFTIQVCAQQEENLLLHYELNNDFTDSSPNGYDGIGVNGVFVQDFLGAPSSALSANGVNTYMDFPELDELEPNFPITVAVRAKFDYLDGTQVLFTTDYSINHHSGVWIQSSSNGNFSAAFGNAQNGFNSSGRRNRTTNNVFEVDTWYCIVAVFNGPDDIKIYVDGDLQDGTYSGTAQSIGYTDQPGSLCRKRANPENILPPYYFAGDLDEFKMWDVELTEDEIITFCNSSSVDCDDLMANIGDPCELNGEQGVINENCECIVDCPSYLIDAPPTACLNSSIQLALTPIAEAEVNLVVNWGDQSNPEIFDGDVFDHIYEATGTYNVTVQGSIGECEIDLSTEVAVQGFPSLNLPDTVYNCYNEPFTLDFTGLDFDVVNESGIVVSSFETSASGSYSFTAQNLCGEDEQSVVVFFENISPTQLAAPSVICEGSETLTIGFEEDYYDFLWNDGRPTSAINITEPGIYSVVVSSGGSCNANYSFNISPQEPLNLNRFPDGTVELCSEGNRTIILPNFGFDYSFPNGEEGQAYEAMESEILELSFSDECYDYNVEIDIELIDCLCPVYIPNAFSPDSDGLNDLFKASANCELESFHMMIFNRWGNLVFESHDIDTGWNGYSGNESYYTSPGIYFYIVEYGQKLDGLIIPNELKGHITLLR